MNRNPSISINIVIIAVIALLVLVVLSYIFIAKLNPCNEYDPEKCDCIVYKHYEITYSPHPECCAMTGEELNDPRYDYVVGRECVDWVRK